MARKLSLSPTPSAAEQLSFPEIEIREPPGEVTPLARRPFRARAGTRAPTTRVLRGPPTEGDRPPPRVWRLPRAVEILDEIIACAIIVLLFLAVALPLFLWIEH